MEKEKIYYCVVEYTQERKCNIVSVNETEEEAVVNQIKWTSDSDGSNQYIVASLPRDIIKGSVEFSIMQTANARYIIEDIKNVYKTSGYFNSVGELREKDYRKIYNLFKKTEDCNVDYNSTVENAINTFFLNKEKYFEKIAYNCVCWLGDHFSEDETNAILCDFGVDEKHVEKTVDNFTFSELISIIRNMLEYLEKHLSDDEDLFLALQHLGMNKDDFDFFEFPINELEKYEKIDDQIDIYCQTT